MNNIVAKFPEAFCQICQNIKLIDEVVYVSTPEHMELQPKLTGNKKECPGCDGTGISNRARQWRKDHDWK